MSVHSILRSLAVAAALAVPALALAQAVHVPGTSNPKLAGMPDGSSDGSDTAPDESPVLFTGFDLIPGMELHFAVTGVVGNCRGCESETPDGGRQFSSDDRNGIAGMRGPINSLVAVFLTDAQPDLSATPLQLDFETLGTDFLTLSPLLKQVFFIGDGLTGTGSGAMQSFVIPTGATRMYLGTHDGFGWFNNVGAFEVTVTTVPEPQTFALMAAGLGIVGWTARRRRRG